MKTRIVEVMVRARVEIPTNYEVVTDAVGVGCSIMSSFGVLFHPLVAFETEDGEVYADDFDLRSVGMEVVGYEESTVEE